MNRHDLKIRMLSAIMAVMMVLSLVGTAFGEDGESVHYGRVNADKVRFRKTASSSASWWCYLDTGWVVEISEEKGDYYKVRCNIPNNIDRNYIGYLMKDYVDVMDANEQLLWLENPLQPTGDKAYTSQDVTVVSPTEKPTQKPAETDDGNKATPAPDGTGVFGYVTDDDVFFRQAPGSEIYWSQLPSGWILEVLSTTDKDANGVTWYEVRGGIPSNTSGSYKGYIHGDFFKVLADGETAVLPTQAPTAGITPAATEKPTLAPANDDDAVYGYINADKVFFRSKPNTSAMYWCFLHTGWQLEVTGEVKNSKGDVEWYKVKGGTPSDPDHTYHGYIMADYLTVGGTVSKPTATPKPTDGETYSNYGLILVSGTNVREKADSSSTALTALATGTLVEWISESGNYVKIKTGSTTGYVGSANVRRLTADEYATLSGATAIPTVKPTQKPAENPDGELGYIKLIKGGVNVRKTPNGSTLTPTSDLWLPKGTVMAYYAAPVGAGSYDWIKVSYNGSWGYIRSDCYEILTTVEKPEETPDVDTEATGYIRLTKGGVNLRSEASLSSKQIYGREDVDTVMPYFGKKINEKTGTTWYYVYSQKHQVYGYISGEYAVLSKADGSDMAGDAVEGVVTGYAITTAGKVYVRKSTSTSSANLTQVPKAGTVLEMWADPVKVGQVTWVPVTYEGYSGYIHGKYAYQLGDWQLDEFNQTGVMPTPTVSPTPVPTGDSTYIVITKDNVWVRSGAGTSYAPIGNKTQVDQGEVYKFTKVVSGGGVDWYRILYNSSTIAYIHSGYARVMTQVEYLQWAEKQTPSANATATPDIEINPPSEYVVLKLGSSGEDVLELQKALHKLGFLAKDDISGEYLASTVDAVKAFQKANKITVDGIAGKTTQSEIYRIVTGGNNSGSSINGVTLYPVELSDWDTGDIQKVWAKGETAVVTDVYTGISFVARRWSGYLHADVEPLTAKDTAAMCKIYGVSDAQEIEDRTNELQTWRRRPLWVTVDGRTFAASMYGVPHNYPDGDTIRDNNYNGQFCIHFVNSRVHKSEAIDVDSAKNGYFGHQSAIKYAYKHSISGTK